MKQKKNVFACSFLKKILNFASMTIQVTYRRTCRLSMRVVMEDDEENE